jgi:hypothetical protein
MSTNGTLTENDVVDAVAEHLKSAGWTITQVLRTTEQGVDLIATRGAERLLLEAKGRTSLSVTSARYGKGFDTSQQRDHVAKAVAVACALRSCEPGSRVGIAFPDTPTHRNRIEAVKFALGLLSVWAYIVRQDRTVEQVV